MVHDLFRRSNQTIEWGEHIEQKVDTKPAFIHAIS